MGIIGHRQIVKYLKIARSKNQLAHAYLFIGPKSVGKRTTAENFLLSLLKLPKLDNPDLVNINRGSTTIGIDEVRNLKHFFQTKAFDEKIKLALVVDADRLTIEAQSALLKTLEEPKGDSLIILTTARPSKLLPTIKSRLEAINFYPVPRKELLLFLNKNGLLEVSRALLDESQNLPGRLLNLLRQKEKIAASQSIKLYQELDGLDLASCFNLAKNMSSQPNFDISQTLQVYLSAARSNLLKSLRSDGSDQTKIVNRLDLILKSFFRSACQVNKRLILESLFLQW